MYKIVYLASCFYGVVVNGEKPIGGSSHDGEGFGGGGNVGFGFPGCVLT